jgi:mannose-6-phosphate isomerase-like protein (cupin superfamily)
MTETDKTTFAIHQMALDNTDFRKVVKTGSKMQVVLMAVPAGEEIGAEEHEGHDQVLIFVEGEGKAVIGGVETAVSAGDLTFVSSGTHHNFINTGEGYLKLYTMYAPPEHEAGTEHHTKAQADAAEHDH